MKTALIIIAVFVSSSLFADIIHVPADTSTIQGGINLASEGDTVLVAENTYYENINFRGKAITVASQFFMDGDTSHISKTIIDGSQPTNPDSGSVVTFDSGEDTTSVLCGFTITNGTGNKTYVLMHQSYELQGGGIHLYESSAKILNSIITNNNIESGSLIGAGGGIAALSFEPSTRFVIIRECRISSNNITGRYAAGGGIVAAHMNINYIIEKNIISNNKIYCTSSWKGVGAGIGIDHALPTSGTMIVRNNHIKGNEVHGVLCFGGGLYIVLWEIGDNTYDREPNPIIYNNIFSDNYSVWKGGAIALWVGTLSNTAPSSNLNICPQPAFINNTIVNNRAAKGSGIYCYYSNFLLMNSILCNDLSLQGSNEIDMSETGASNWDAFPNDNSISIYNTIIQDGNWNDFNNKVFATDPLFVDSLYHLSENSPAIGMGRKSIYIDGATYEIPVYDIDGSIRPNAVDTLVDIGAYESPYTRLNFVYPKSMEITDENPYLNPATDYLGFTSKIDNPDNHNINVFARIVSVDNALKDSVELYDDGAHNDAEAGDLIFGGQLEPINEENEFRLSMGIKDNDQGTYNIFNDKKWITTIGRITVENPNLEYVFGGTMYALNLSLRNLGQTTTAQNITIELTTTDTTSFSSIVKMNKDAIDIPAGQIIEIEQSHNINFTSTVSDSIPFTVKIYSNGYHFWTDSLDVVTSLENELQKVPKIFSLRQNTPNPFNPVTSINYQLPKASEVNLSIFNVLGQKVVTLVNERQNVGTYKVKWDATNFASGIYYYKLDADEYVDVKKMILIK